MGRRLLLKLLFPVLALVPLLPTTALAQTGAIAGAVKDTTGAVLPGVTVEAASPALIEKVRSVVTDSQGQYKILDLRPGTYTVTFTLTGFSTVKRETIELTAGFTAGVNVELRLGSLSETITVSGESPVVDVQNVRQQAVMTRDLIDNLPTGKSFQNLATLIPGVFVAGTSGGGVLGQDVGGQANGGYIYLSVHGSRGQEMPLLLDGMRYINMNGQAGGYNATFKVNNLSSQEFTIETGGLSAESDVSGVRINAVPRDGGNQLRISFYTNYTNDKLQANNGTDPTRTTSYPKVFDINAGVGGPLRKDKVWFYTAHRYSGQYQRPPGAFWDVNPLDFVYTPDLSRPVINRTWNRSSDVRLTWQATARNKIGVFHGEQGGCTCNLGVSATVAPEASTVLDLSPNRLTQATWNVVFSNRLLFDAGETYYGAGVTLSPQPEVTPDVYAATELSRGVNFRAATLLRRTDYPEHNGKVNLTYVTGSHAVKVGGQWLGGYRRTAATLNNDQTLALLNGVPASVTQFTTPYTSTERVNWLAGMFVQDQSTLKRLTLTLGVRFDFLNSSIDPVHLPPVQFVGARDFGAVSDVPNWKDISPRIGAAYDLFGNGKTALKVSTGRYILGMSTDWAGANNPINTSVNSATRTWNDLNRDFIPQPDELGPLSNANFGKSIITTRYDRAATEGWGTRGFNWETLASVQHELSRGVSLNATYARHWGGNFVVTDNLATSPSDFSPYCVTAPVDSRLPGGGGNQLCGFFDVNPAKFGQVNNLITLAKIYGDQSDFYNGFDVSVTARLPGGATLQGGTSTGREVTDNCDVAGKTENAAAGSSGGYFAVSTGGFNQSLLPSPSTLFCRVTPPFLTQAKASAVYPLPWGLLTSVTFQSLPGAMITASRVVTSAEAAPSLGRNFSAGANATAIVQLIEPGSQYGDRLNQVDARLAKNINLGRTRVQGQLDLYNLLNANPVLALNTRYGPTWLQPTSVLPGRLLKFGVQIEY